STDASLIATFPPHQNAGAETAPSNPLADRLRRQTDDRCIAPGAQHRPLAQAAFAQVQASTLGTALAPPNRELRGVAGEISPVSVCSPSREGLRLTVPDHVRAPAPDCRR